MNKGTVCISSGTEECSLAPSNGTSYGSVSGMPFLPCQWVSASCEASLGPPSATPVNHTLRQSFDYYGRAFYIIKLESEVLAITCSSFVFLTVFRTKEGECYFLVCGSFPRLAKSRYSLDFLLNGDNTQTQEVRETCNLPSSLPSAAIFLKKCACKR